MVCRHCSRDRANRSRGLCWACFERPAVRAKYAPARHRRGAAPDFYGRAPLPESPTDAAPGSPEKVAVMAERASRGRALFHPRDAGAKRATG